MMISGSIADPAVIAVDSTLSRFRPAIGAPEQKTEAERPPFFYSPRAIAD
jgi:hypothetical protein